MHYMYSVLPDFYKAIMRATINININSKLAGTTMGKNSFEGVVALKRAGLVSTFQTVYSARLQQLRLSA